MRLPPAQRSHALCQSAANAGSVRASRCTAERSVRNDLMGWGGAGTVACRGLSRSAREPTGEHRGHAEPCPTRPLTVVGPNDGPITIGTNSGTVQLGPRKREASRRLNRSEASRSHDRPGRTRTCNARFWSVAAATPALKPLLIFRDLGPGQQRRRRWTTPALTLILALPGPVQPIGALPVVRICRRVQAADSSADWSSAARL